MRRATVLLFAVCILSAFAFASGPILNYYVAEPFSTPYGKYGLGAWTGGTSASTDASAKIEKNTIFGHVWEIYYNVEKEGSYNGTWLAFANTNMNQVFAASPTYSKLIFFVKSDSTVPMNFKVELKSPNNGVEYYYVTGITENWVLVIVPFKKFKKYSWTNNTNFSQLIQMTFVFENNIDIVKKGHIYVADIGFAK